MVISELAPGSMKADRQTSLDSSQAQVQGFEWTYPNIFPMDELECMKGPVSTDPKLQDPPDAEQQQDSQEQS